MGRLAHFHLTNLGILMQATYRTSSLMSSESTAAAQGCGLGTAMLEVVSLTISVPLVNSALAHGLPPPIGSPGMLVPHSSTKREPAFRMGHAARDGPTPVTSGMRRAMGAVWPRWKPTCAGGAVAASRSLGGAPVLTPLMDGFVQFSPTPRTPNG